MRLPGTMAILSALIALTACSDKPAEMTANTESIKTGQAIFEQNCAGCHPRSGRGDYLKRIPVTVLARRSEEELKAWIIGKNQHREMPSFEHLETEQLQALADYLKSQIKR